MDKKFLLFSLLTVLVACGSAKLLTHSQVDADRGSKTFPDLKLSDLDNGKTLFTQNCQTCHALKNPKAKTEEKWRSIVPRMSAKVNKKAGKTVLDSAGQSLILKYVVTMSSAVTEEKK